ncbi:MAG: O-antigen translocase [Verrucomicrobia bacterium]|nr:O-antigen translocase [Verrucomicrobiota bacterium]
MSGDSKQSSYRQVFKATSIFGGAQVFTILIGIVRSKLVAVFLGTAGVGINGLFTSPLALISSISSLGIPFSAVRDIAHANEQGNAEGVSKIILAFRRWVWLTGLVGAVITLCLSPWLSEWSFGTRDYTWGFVVLSLMVFVSAISGGQLGLLRGMRKMKEMALASIIGGSLSLAVAVPLYWIYGTAGIVPAILGGALATLLVSWWYSRKIFLEKVAQSWKESFSLGSGMAKLGILITVSGMVTQLAGWGIYIFVRHVGGLEEVGLYAAGWGMTNQYVGMVFSAMGADYLPRLSGVRDNNAKIREYANQQAEISVLILTPAMVLFMGALPLAVWILFTEDFMPIIPFVSWMLAGMLLKAVSWCLGFIILAKGDSKMFLYTEVGIKFISVPAYLLGYYYCGLSGIGIAFVGIYAFYSILMFFVCRKNYEFTFSRELLTVTGISTGILLIAFIPAIIWGFPVAYLSGATAFLLAGTYSLFELNKRMNLVALCSRVKQKFIRR